MGATLDGWNDIAVAVLFMIPELEVKEVEKDTRSLRQSRRINVGLTCSEAYVSSQDGRDLIGGFESLTLIIRRYFQNNLSGGGAQLSSPLNPVIKLQHFNVFKGVESKI